MTSKAKQLATIIGAFTIGVTGTVAVMGASEQRTPADVPPCYWDASKRGNGKSFVVAESGDVSYLTD